MRESISGLKNLINLSERTVNRIKSKYSFRHLRGELTDEDYADFYKAKSDLFWISYINCNGKGNWQRELGKSMSALKKYGEHKSK